jgi:peptidyl-prolyl cis-trans isomerase A (cyclophilin A)
MRRLLALSALLIGGTMSVEAAKVAVIETNMGTITCELFEKDSPKTVANFVGLATGTKEYKDPKTGQAKKSKYYDGLIFHRVIPDFMIQGGDPLGTGTGGPGYKFEDESPSQTFDRVGRMAMANAGPNTNGSQFFITVAAASFLNTNGHYTIFGQVISGQDVADKISKVPVDDPRHNMPVKPVVIKHVTIQEKK